MADISGRDLVNEKGGLALASKPKCMTFSNKSFSHDVDEKFFKNPRHKTNNLINHYLTRPRPLLLSFGKYDNKVDDLNTLADMRFAASFSEDAFAEHMETKQGRVILTSLPVKTTACIKKWAIRVRDQLLLTNYKPITNNLPQIAPSYRLWQEQTLLNIRHNGRQMLPKRLLAQHSCWV